MKKKFALIVFLIFSQCYVAFANNPQWIVFNNTNSPIPTTDNVSHINDIAINKKGEIFLSSSKKLLKFDYLNWNVYDEENASLPLNKFSEIIIDKSENYC